MTFDELKNKYENLQKQVATLEDERDTIAWELFLEVVNKQLDKKSVAQLHGIYALLTEETDIPNMETAKAEIMDKLLELLECDCAYDEPAYKTIAENGDESIIVSTWGNYFRRNATTGKMKPLSPIQVLEWATVNGVQLDDKFKF